MLSYEIQTEVLEPISAEKTWSLAFYNHQDQLLYLIAVLDVNVKLPHNSHLLLCVGLEGKGGFSQPQVKEQRPLSMVRYNVYGSSCISIFFPCTATGTPCHITVWAYTNIQQTQVMEL